MNIVNNVNGRGLAESSEELQPSFMSYKKLEEGKECLSDYFQGTICPIVFVDMPL